MAAWVGGKFEAEWIQVYVALRQFAAHLKLSHCDWLYKIIQNKKLKKNQLLCDFTVVLSTTGDDAD